MAEMDELARRRAEQQQVISGITDGILHFLGFNTPDLLEKTLAGTEFQPMHPSENGAKAYAVRRTSLQKTLYEIVPQVAATVASLPDGLTYFRPDMDNGDNFTFEVSRDIRRLPGNPEVVLCAQFTITTFDSKSAGITQIEYIRRPGAKHDLLSQLGAFVLHRRS